MTARGHATGRTGVETGSGVVGAKGVADRGLERESAEYQNVLGLLAKETVGAATAFRDRGIIAGAFSAKTEAGVVSRLMSADRQAGTRLARMAKIDANKFGGYPVGEVRADGVRRSHGMPDPDGDPAYADT